MAFRGRQIFLWLLVIVAGVEFGIRGPLRAVRQASEWNDFLSPYIQAKEWLRGMDPYSPSNFGLLCPAGARCDFVAADIADGTLVAGHGVPSPYPLTSFVLLVPITILPWPIAQAFWIVINLAAFLILLGALLSIGGISWREPRGQLFLVMSLALAPFHTGFATENAAVLVAGLSVAALWMANQQWEKTAGILLGIAICLKPPLGLCFLLHFLVCRRWKIVGWCSGWVAVTAFVAISRLAVAGVTWLPTYFQLQRDMFASGAINSFMPSNPVWFHLINLQVIFYAIWPSVFLANGLALVLGFLLLAVWLWTAIKSAVRCDLLTLSCLVTLSLLPFYHRFYDAELLIIPLCWSLTLIDAPLKRFAHLTLALILPFLVPGAALLYWISQSNFLLSTLFHKWWWNAIVMPHANWALLALAIVLLYAMRTRAPEQPTVLAVANSEGLHSVLVSGSNGAK
jgi:Glycosyltransferase family 87